MPDITIRPMVPHDVPACARLMAGSPLWARYNVTAEGASARFEAGLAEGAGLYVAAEEGQIAGFVWCVVRGAFARSGYIPLIGVRPDLAGRGIGAALLAHAENHLGLTTPDVFLLVSEFNSGARRFYRRHGYRRVGALPDYVVPGIVELIYWKRLVR